MNTDTTQEYTRVAIVTGAAQGIGRAIALRLAADGLDVAVADLPGQIDSLNAVVEEIEQLGRKAIAVIADVSKEEDVKAMVEATVSALGRLDVMVANAGVVNGAGGVVSVMDAKVEDWQKGWDVNIRGTLLCYQYAARQMVKQGAGGRIIGASSICGQRGYAGVGGYCISKAAVRSMTQTAGALALIIKFGSPTHASKALELRKEGITVNAYAPGVIETKMTIMQADEGHYHGYGLKQFFKIPDVRTGKPADVANVASFLASPHSHFITGQTISVDDGVHFA
ncbi:Diacetyl reductase [Mycena venus]|uniref:Diacetyl reductase n=1 Tax=Mycena venus TaxID=2733690 RepID=A0A8H7CJS2_9AGAR|nr:Diacetyl reductase [Mycena venus]